VRGARYAIVGDELHGVRVVGCEVGTLPPALAGEGLIALGTMRIRTEGGGEVVALLVAVDQGDALTMLKPARRMAVYYDRAARELRTVYVEVRP
jgi:hypothetical protein